MQEPIGGIHWLPESEYKEIVSRARMQFNEIFRPLSTMYGQHPICMQAIEECIKLCEDFGLRVRGVKNHPISITMIRSK